MQSQTISRARTKLSASPGGAVAYAGAAAFVIGTVWNELVSKAITVTAAPQMTPRTPLAQRIHTYYRWWVTTLGQERLFMTVLIIGFLCLAAAALVIRDLLGRDRPLPRAGTTAITVGAVLWITGAVLQLGGHRAVGLMATHANPVLTVDSIAFTVDMIAQAFALATFAFIGAGLLAYARAAVQTHPQLRLWAGYTLVSAVFSLVIAVTYATDSGDTTDLLLLIGGVVVMPLWLIWTGRLARQPV
jgi:hypothetical protein